MAFELPSGSVQEVEPPCSSCWTRSPAWRRTLPAFSRPQVRPSLHDEHSAFAAPAGGLHALCMRGSCKQLYSSADQPYCAPGRWRALHAQHCLWRRQMRAAPHFISTCLQGPSLGGGSAQQYLSMMQSTECRHCLLARIPCHLYGPCLQHAWQCASPRHPFRLIGQMVEEFPSLFGA